MYIGKIAVQLQAAAAQLGRGLRAIDRGRPGIDDNAIGRGSRARRYGGKLQILVIHIEAAHLRPQMAIEPLGFGPDLIVID
jgi:hypothetical protein